MLNRFPLTLLIFALSFKALASGLTVTLVGGPTVLIEVDGFRILTDPTFDPAPMVYKSGVALKKTQSPSLDPSLINEIDLILLSHDQHADNLDELGRSFLKKSKLVVSTPDASKRLGKGVVGLKPWESRTLLSKSGREFIITALPARHGPEGIEPMAGEVVGFVVTDKKTKEDLFYATGDTVFYDAISEVAKRINPKIIFAFAGAAQPEGAKVRFTMNAKEVLQLSLAFPASMIAPVHVDSWEHFREGRSEIEKAFQEAKRSHKLFLLEKGSKHSL